MLRKCFFNKDEQELAIIKITYDKDYKIEYFNELILKLKKKNVRIIEKDIDSGKNLSN